MYSENSQLALRNAHELTAELQSKTLGVSSVQTDETQEQWVTAYMNWVNSPDVQKVLLDWIPIIATTAAGDLVCKVASRGDLCNRGVFRQLENPLALLLMTLEVVLREISGQVTPK